MTAKKNRLPKSCDVDFEISKDGEGSLACLKDMKMFPIQRPFSLGAKEIQAMEDEEISEWLEEMSIVYPIMEE